VTTIAEFLRAAPSDEARRDFEVLIAHVLGVSRAYLYAHGDEPRGSNDTQRIAHALEQYRGGTPVAYITGRRDFWTLTLDVDPAVLIPRPETELLVELALQRLSRNARVLDLGTGSGAIALAIKRERGECAVTGTDLSADAIAVAKRNAERHQLDVDLRIGDWYAVVDGAFDVIVSNPPYIRADDPHLSALVGEPTLALVGGADGLDALRTIVSGAPDHLISGGHLLVEHGFDQADHVRRMFERAGFRRVTTHRDVAGHERVTLGER
jgi:release factor glutamine methyltransferase